MKYIFSGFYIILLTSCCNYSTSAAVYEVSGTKKNVTIKCRGVNSRNVQEKDLTTIIIDKLPWEKMYFMSQSSCLEKIPWFLSAYSESEGEMTISINGYTNTTTNNYIEMSLPVGGRLEGYEYMNYLHK